MNDRTYFAEQQAAALVGSRVHARIALDGAPAGTPGHVGTARRTSLWGGWVVNVVWEVPGGPWRYSNKLSADEYDRWCEAE